MRIQFAGACYHLLNRGDRREPIFREDADRLDFLGCLEKVVAKCGWEVHAFCLLPDHFHLLVTTPQPNLVVGMKWFLGTYTLRFNRRHRLTGHVFSGRYKSILIDSRTPGYLTHASDYVHLNPLRAGIVPTPAGLASHPWSSFPGYVDPSARPAWLHVARLFHERGIAVDDEAGRTRFREAVEAVALKGQSDEILGSMRRGWKLGGKDFVREVARILGRNGSNHALTIEERETDQVRAEDLIERQLQASGLQLENLARLPKGHVIKVNIARQLRTETPVSRAWIAQRLHMGSASYVSQLLGGTAAPITPGRYSRTRPIIR